MSSSMSPYTTRDTAIKWSAYTLACLALLFVHALTLSRLCVWGIAPFLPPLLPAVIASMEERLESVLFALAFGMACDLTLMAPLPCLYTVSFTLAALLASFLAGNVLQPGFLCSIAVSAATFAVVDVLVAAALLVGGRATLSALMLRAVREAALSLPLLIVCHPVIALVHRRFRL